MSPHLVVAAVGIALSKHDLRWPGWRGKPQRVVKRAPELLRLGRREPLGKRRVVAAREADPTICLDHLETVVAGHRRLDIDRRMVRPRQRFDHEAVEAVRLDAGAAGLIEVES